MLSPCDAHPLHLALVVTQGLCPSARRVRDNWRDGDKQNEREIREQRSKPSLYDIEQVFRVTPSVLGTLLKVFLVMLTLCTLCGLQLVSFASVEEW